MKVMLKDPLVKGHPLHALLTDLPIGALAVGITCDAIGLISRKPAWRFSARAAHTAAFVSGLLAAGAGLWDYQAVPREHPAHRTGALHGWINAGMLSLLLASLILRRKSQPEDEGAPDAAALAFAGAAFATLVASGWLGGDLVFHLGWRVSPAERAEQLEAALSARGDTSLIEQASETVREYERTHALIP